MTIFTNFLRDESGAVTIDWVALTAGILLLGIAVVYGIFSNGVDPLVGQINSSLSNAALSAPTPTLTTSNF
jgi:Flp pilus assembly pilin Flp